MDGYTAKYLSTIGGIATVSILLSFIPTHWLPFSIVGRAQKWNLSRTLLVTALGALLHVISTSLLAITAITMVNTIAGEENSTQICLTSAHISLAGVMFYLERVVTAILTTKPWRKWLLLDLFLFLHYHLVVQRFRYFLLLEIRPQ